MTADKHEVLRALRNELNFLEQGGFQPTTEDGRQRSPFKSSMVCLNYGDPSRPHACRECLLYDFVPEEARTEDVPCHFVPLNESGDTVASLQARAQEAEILEALKTWLKRTIAQLEREVENGDRSPVAP
jgi:hypothetical protein